MSHAAPKLRASDIIAAQSYSLLGMRWESLEEHRGWTQSSWWELSRGKDA